jgi:hypothetical protein
MRRKVERFDVQYAAPAYDEPWGRIREIHALDVIPPLHPGDVILDAASGAGRFFSMTLEGGGAAFLARTGLNGWAFHGRRSVRVVRQRPGRHQLLLSDGSLRDDVDACFESRAIPISPRSTVVSARTGSRHTPAQGM